MKHSILIITIFILITTALDATARQKTDVVVINNGDRVTCEIKELSRGKLEINTDAMETIYIEWDHIKALQSGFYYRVGSSDGGRYFGSLEMKSDSDEFLIKSDSLIVVLKAVNVIEIMPLETSFWQQIDGSLTGGYKYTKASDVKEIFFTSSNNYRTMRNLVHTKLDGTLTENPDKTTRSAKAALDYTRLLRGKWSGTMSASIERNDEMDLARRFLGSIETGVTPIKGNRNILLLSAGLAVNSELATGETKTTESMEWSFRANYSMFKYNTPERKIDVKLNVYPSITEGGRYRVDFESKLRREIIKDFFFDLTYTLNYDSNSVSGGGVKKDYGIETSIGYSY